MVELRWFVFILFTSVSLADYVRICYYTNWAQYRQGVAKYVVSNIDPFLCTHIVYAFAKIESKRLAMYEWNDEKYYKEATDLKKVNPSLKVLLAVGGWNHEGNPNFSPFSDMVKTNDTRNVFISDAISYLRRYNFDGLDLDWEYPAQRGNSDPSDREKFTLLCKELRQAFTNEQKQSGKEQLLLTAAVAAGASSIGKSYEVSKLGEHLDMLHLMSYDLAGAWDGSTGHHTAMQADNGNSVTNGLDTWIKGGFPANKIALGLATYGRSFTLTSEISNGIGATSSSAGSSGVYTKENGFLSYYEICQKISDGMVVVRDSQAQAPYGYQGTFWVGYDDEESLRVKVRTLVKGKLKGVMFWALDLDDFTGSFCNKGKSPLMNAVRDELTNSITTTTTTTTTTEVPTTQTTMTHVSTSQASTTKPPVTQTSTTQKATTHAPTTQTTTTQQPQTTSEQTTSTSPTLNPTNPSGCFAINAWYGNTEMDKWCIENCAMGYCPDTHCSCDPNWKPYDKCRVIEPYTSSYPEDWCNLNCPLGNCPSTHCICDEEKTSSTTTQAPTNPPGCFAINDWYGQKAVDEWCKINCAAGYCPKTHCSCDPNWKP